VWNAGQARWRLVEPEVTDTFVTSYAAGGPFDPLDVPRDRFIPGQGRVHGGTLCA